MGGRIASQVAAQGAGALRGLVFLGYPLHPPKQPERLLAAHLPSVGAPMLFVQGERDPFGSPDELAPHLSKSARVYAVAGGDHSLRVPRRAGKPQSEIYGAIQDEIARFLK
jgi:predicted alpha/beta-hydrolase family hydrolase